MDILCRRSHISLLLFIGLCATLLSHSGNAQTSKDKEDLKKLTPEQRAKMLTDSMKVYLPLQTNQYASVYAVNLKYAQKAEPILKGTDSKITKYYKINSMQSDKEEEYKKILTEAQFKKYMELKDRLMKRALNKI